MADTLIARAKHADPTRGRRKISGLCHSVRCTADWNRGNVPAAAKVQVMKRMFAKVVVPIGFFTFVACGARSPLDSMDDGTGESNGGAGGIFLGSGGRPGAGGFTLSTGGRPGDGGTTLIITGGFIGSGGRPATGGFATTGGRINSGGAYGGYIVDGGSGGHGGYTPLGGSIPAGGQTITGGKAGGITGNSGGSGGRGGSGGGGMMGGAAGTARFDGGFGGSGGLMGDGGPRDLGIERGDALMFGDVKGTGGGSGGSVATGGSGGCQGLASNEELIDDLNDGDRLIPKLNGRVGAWADSGDGTPGGSMYPDPTAPFVPTDTGDPCRKYAAYVKGTGFSDSGARLWVGLGAPYDASRYTGISFWARTDVGTSPALRVAFPDKDTQPEGGICQTNVTGPTQCYDHYGFRLNLTSTWTKYTITFKELSQDGWGLQGSAFDPASLFEIQFQISVNATFSMWIDDLAFTM